MYSSVRIVNPFPRGTQLCQLESSADAGLDLVMIPADSSNFQSYLGQQFLPRPF